MVRNFRKMKMGKAFWIKIAIRLFVKWLDNREVSGTKRTVGGTSNIMVNELLKAQSLDDLKKIAESETTPQAIESIVTEIAEEPVGGVLDGLFGGK